MENLNNSERENCEKLLKSKLDGIPKDHLPNLALTDILRQSPKATHLNKIPSDLQLDYFFANHARIKRDGGLAVKDYQDQSLNITRAIFYYRVDQTHQFARYHDDSRWNLAFFCALLCQHEKTRPDATPQPVHRIDSSRKRFIIAYLEAVLEHHADECVFEKRDAFVKMWKGNSFDFFSLKAGQKKIMKGEMKRLKAEFEIELDSLKDSMRSEQYEERVAKFVGSLVPGRQDQKRGGGGGVNWLYALNQSHDMNNDEQNEQNAREDSAVDMETGLEENKLLEALKVPRAAKDWEGNVNGKAKNAICLNTVVESGVAIEAVKITTAKDIMEMLVGRFG